MELIDILDAQGNKTGVIKTKKEAHDQGLWHQSAHIWIVNSKNEVLLQRRSKLMENYPDMWDISVAGHVSSGEKVEQAALREIKEEVGVALDISELQLIGKNKHEQVLNNGTYFDKEFDYIYLIRKDLNIGELQLQTEEVNEIKWLPIPEFKKWVAEKKVDLVPHAEECDILFRAIGF